TGGTTSGLALSQTSPAIVAGKSTSVYISGPPVAYYVSSNSQPSVAQASITQNLITVNGIAQGSTQMQICSPSGSCTTLSVQVLSNTNNTSNAALVLSNTSLALTVGGAGTVFAAGSGSFTATSNEPDVATSSIMNGTNVVVTGEQVGTATIQVC